MHREHRAFRAAAAVGIAALLTIASGAFAGTSSNWKRFTSTRYGYSVTYPSGWKAVKARTSVLTRGFPLEDGAEVDKLLSCGDSCAKGIDVVFYARKLRPRTTLTSFAAHEARALAAFGCGGETRTRVRLGGASATRLEYASCLANYMVETVAVHGGRGYDVYLLAPPGHKARDRATLQQILGTFRFTR